MVRQFSKQAAFATFILIAGIILYTSENVKDVFFNIVAVVNINAHSVANSFLASTNAAIVIDTLAIRFYSLFCTNSGAC